MDIKATMKLYVVKLAVPVEDNGGYLTAWLNVVASSVEAAATVVKDIFPDCSINAVDLTKTKPIIIGN